MARNTEEAVEALVQEILAAQSEISLVDVEYVKERDWYLRVYIDKEGGIEIDDCQSLSEKLSDILDKRDVIPESYVLEVSSPGLDRVLRKPRDFLREKGKMVDVSFYAPVDGKKQCTGILESCDGEVLVLEGAPEIPMDKVSMIRLHIDF